ncbi:MAG: hypothetical protein ACI4J1_00435 [Ruminiclostridium sp.]
MIKTVNLSANAETCVTELGGAHTRIVNNTAGILYASANPEIVSGGDDVLSIGAGNAACVVDTNGTVYLLATASGTVQCEGTDILSRPLDGPAFGTGINALSGVVTMRKNVDCSGLVAENEDFKEISVTVGGNSAVIRPVCSCGFYASAKPNVVPDGDDAYYCTSRENSVIPNTMGTVYLRITKDTGLVYVTGGYNLDKNSV